MPLGSSSAAPVMTPGPRRLVRLFRDKADERTHCQRAKFLSRIRLGSRSIAKGDRSDVVRSAFSQQARIAQPPIAEQHGGVAWPRPNPRKTAAMTTGPAAVAGHPAGSYPNGQRRRRRSAFLIRPCNARGRETFGLLDEEYNDYRRMLVWSGELARNVRP